MNKILFRIFHDRLQALLPNLISKDQLGFIKDRSIIKNVLHTQEIVIDIRKKGKPANVVIKVAMCKVSQMIFLI